MEGSPWDMARAAADRGGVTLVPLTEFDDIPCVTSVVEEVWGPEQALPQELVRALQHAGVVLYGAESDRRCVGFVLGFLGFSEGVHLHSHMLAVLPGEEDRGIGYALKLAQRAASLDAGVEEVRWTFDPLVAKNARFNLVKLGAVATGYWPAFYGEMSDRLNRGDRSDRFEVRWKLVSERVRRALSGDPVPPAEGSVVRVEIPPDHHRLKAEDPTLAGDWRRSSGEVFTRCFESGMVATWYSPGEGYVFESGDRLEN